MLNQKPLSGELIDYGHPLSQGLIACWFMPEGSGNTIQDSSGNNNYGVLEGTAPTWKVCKYGSAVDLPDTDETIHIYHNSSLNTTKACTVITWIYPRDWDSDSEILRKGNEWILLDIDSNTEFRFYVFGPNIEANIVDASFTLNRLYCVAGTYDGSAAKIYVDGILRETTAGSGDITVTDASPIHIGSNSAASNFFDGLISHVYIYNRALSASEIALLYYEPFCFVGRKRRIIYDEIAAAAGLGIPIVMHHRKLLEVA